MGDATTRMPSSRAAFQAYSEAFAQAQASAPDRVSATRLRCGGGSIEMCCVGAQLAAQIARPLLPADAVAPPRLRLDVWDGEACAVDPAITGSADEPGSRHGVQGEQVAYSSCGRYLRYSGLGFVFWFDRHSSHIVGRCDSADALTWWNRSRPLQPLVGAWLLDAGVVSFHAAVVARHGRGVLLAGPNGSGKSTCSVAALDAGLDFLGDDFASVALGPQRATGHSVYLTLKLPWDALAGRPSLAARAEPGGDPAEEEWVLFVTEAAPQRTVASTELVAVVFPEIADSHGSRMERVPTGRALLELLPCLLTVERGRVGESYGAARALVRTLPAFRLEVGRSARELGTALTDLCRQ